MNTTSETSSYAAVKANDILMVNGTRIHVLSVDHNGPDTYITHSGGVDYRLGRVAVTRLVQV